MSDLPALRAEKALPLSRRTVTLSACLGLSAILGMAMPAARSAVADDRDIAQALRAGGLVIVVRHGATFSDQADTDPLNFDNIAAQRTLNDKGKMLAKEFGVALREAGVPVGAVYTSKYNRAYETAVLAGLKDIEKTADLTEGGLVYPPTRTIAALRPFVNCSPRCPKPELTPFSSPIIRTSSRRSVKTGST